MRLIYRTILITVIPVFLLSIERGYTQMLGNTIHSLRPNEVAFGIAVESMHRHMDVGSFSSSRLMLKGSYGITGWWTISGMGGGANMYFNPPAGSLLSNFRGTFEWGYGGNTRVTLINKGIEVFGFGGGLRTFSSGTVSYSLEAAKIDLRYDWREFWAGVGLLFTVRKWSLYLVGEDRAIQWVEVTNGKTSTSGFKPNIIAGTEYPITSKFGINVQFKYLNEFAFVIGIYERSIGL